MGHPRSSSVAFGCLTTVSLLICTSISQPLPQPQQHHPQHPPPQHPPPHHPPPHHPPPHHAPPPHPHQQQPPQRHQQPPTPPQQQQQEQQPPNLTNELKVEIISKPSYCERTSRKSNVLTIHYSGKVAATNVEFDSTHTRQEPFKFQLGAAAVIRGWEEGLKDMCVGEIRKLTVPPHMGYGDRVFELIPAKSTLIYEVELVNIEEGEKIPNVFRLIDVNGDQLLSRDEVKHYIHAETVRHGMKKDADDAMLLEIFKQEDKNYDGFISHAEFSGPKHDEL